MTDSDLGTRLHPQIFSAIIVNQYFCSHLAFLLVTMVSVIRVASLAISSGRHSYCFVDEAMLRELLDIVAALLQQRKHIPHWVGHEGP